jgi:hypothetical protein
LSPKTSNIILFFFDRVPIDLSNATSSSQKIESLVMLVDPTQVATNLANNKKKKKIYELKHHGLLSCLGQNLLWVLRGKPHKSNARFVISLMGEIGFW